MPNLRAAFPAVVLPFAGAVNGIGCHSATHSYETVNGNVELVDYQGRRAVHLVAPPDKRSTDVHLLAIAPGIEFSEGTIQVDVAESPFDGIPGARGFIGIAFHVEPSGSRFECFYLRPTNGRAEDQLRRNHSTQYISHPDFPLAETARIEPRPVRVLCRHSARPMDRGSGSSSKARRRDFFVNQAEQPALIVNDLKLGEMGGRLALWAHASTDAYFSRLETSPD